jgi:hypothetical protein
MNSVKRQGQLVRLNPKQDALICAKLDHRQCCEVSGCIHWTGQGTLCHPKRHFASAFGALLLVQPE